MKQLFYSISIALLFSLIGCNDWLDVKPRSETRADQLFETEDGFKSALTGVYINMADQKLYGRNTTMFIPDAMARLWVVPRLATSNTSLSRINNTLNKFSNLDFEFEVNEDSESMLSTVWTSYYNCIAQLNNILENIDESNADFRYQNDKLIKGEALGLRAFLHLELLRYWGPVPSESSGGNTKGIPYLTTMSKDPNLLVSKPYQEVVSLIEKDLDDAEKLLEEADPVLSHSIPSLNNIYSSGIPEDKWQLFRQNRFNYYAVLGTKARFFQWIGNKPKALEYALKVIDAKDDEDDLQFKLVNEASFSSNSASLSMSQESLFALHNPDLQKIIEPLFVNSTPVLTQTEKELDNAYEKGVHNDIRYKPTNNVNRYWEKKTYQHSVEANHFYKFSGNSQIQSNNQIPILRLSEMYFIAIENLTIGEFMPYFQKYRVARGLDISIEDGLTDETKLLLRLEKEYRKDFFGEGQLFFFYKRHNYTTYTWPKNFTVPTNAYVLPRPKGQESFE